MGLCNNECKQYGHPNPVSTPETGRIKQRERGKKCAPESYQGGKSELPFSPEGVNDQRSFGFGFSECINQGLSTLYKHKENKEACKDGNDYPPVLLQSKYCECFVHVIFLLVLVRF